MSSEPVRSDPVIDLLLSGRAETVDQAEELYLDTHLGDVFRLVESDLSEEAFRAHWGPETAKAVWSRLKDKGLTLIYRKHYSELSAADKAEFEKLAQEAGDDPAALAGQEDTMLSTQFFKTELNAALKEKTDAQDADIGDLKGAMSHVAKGAHIQSRTAVTVALEKSDRDGSKEDRQAALAELPAKSAATWKGQPGVDEIDMF